MNERIVALDVGDRRIGIAVSDALGITAQPIETYTRVGYGPDVRRICQIAQQYETNRILCGLPLNMDGSRGFQAEKVAQLAEKLEEAGLVVSYYDERMTTVLAEDALLEANMSRENRKKKVDMVAAVMILQSYLDAQAMQSASVDADADDSDEDDGVLEMEDEDGNVIAGAVFGLFREGETEFTEETAVRVTESDSTGKFRFEDIRYGKWIIRELKPATGYVLNETPFEVEITEDGKTVFITVENKFIRGDIKGYKVDEDGKSVVGALFGLFTEDDTEFTEENAVLTAVSDADGIFTFKNVRFGKWIVRELKSAEGFVLNETEFPVDITTDGAVIEIKAENRHIYGAVHTTKVDKDYPDHLLTGAVFEVYRDVNGNQQFDPDVDELVGTLSECEPGLYELAELRYGGYFLYEKQAPVNYVKDNGYYYFEIVTDGEMVKVENQAGVGFINDHMVGNLKIVKASSDGRVEGFSFRITGENYDEVFTTDANGEIFIENLRIGKYTVTEVEDGVSAGYKRPDPFEIELAADETLTVNVHNDKVTTDHPDSPKTGDNSHMALWLGLMLASLGVLIGTILYSRKKKHLAD